MKWPPVDEWLGPWHPIRRAGSVVAYQRLYLILGKSQRYIFPIVDDFWDWWPLSGRADAVMAQIDRLGEAREAARRARAGGDDG